MIYNKSILKGKIHDSLEDPVSQLLYEASDIISPGLNAMNITPNLITTIRLLLMLVVFPYFFVNKKYKLAATIYIISYFGDCLDGHMSRKYNLATTFGDYYDYTADTLGLIVSIYFIAISLNAEFTWILFLLAFILLLSFVQTSCQKRYLESMG